MKNEKQESPAAEILWLRGLRAFVAENSTERLLVEADALDAARAETEADKQALFLRTLTLIERGEGGLLQPSAAICGAERKRGEGRRGAGNPQALGGAAADGERDKAKI